MTGTTGAVFMDDYGFAAVRYNLDGSLDTSFGANGWAYRNVGSLDIAYGAVATDVGFIMVGSTTARNSNIPAPVLAAFTNTGGIDTRYNFNGNQIKSGDSFSFLAIARASSQRLVIAGGQYVTRILEPNANVVGLGNFDTTMSEAGSNTGGLIVYRTKRLPYATRVYLQASGSAIAPGSGNTNIDFTGFSNSPLSNYVDIPANQTFASLTLTPIDDTRNEGTEYVKMSIVPNASYDAGTLPILDYVLYNNEADETIIDNTQAVQTSAGGTTTVTVNQQQHGGEWMSLGTYQFNPSGGSVTIRTTGTNGYVVADAVRFVKTVAPQAFIKDTSDPGVTVTGVSP